LKKPANVELFKQAWQAPIKSEHPQIRFHVAKSRLRQKYIELQTKNKQTANYSDSESYNSTTKGH
jgi:hypothetical protein